MIHMFFFFSICNATVTMLITTRQKKVSQRTVTVVRIKLTYFVSKENVTTSYLLCSIGKCFFQIVTNTASPPPPLAFISLAYW
uniref:Uncharacterized protein n=1 Tax=Rhipicephalus zambeziensis TaxID=60191 RepID=A0A224YAR8_9ACAR